MYILKRLISQSLRTKAMGHAPGAEGSKSLLEGLFAVNKPFGLTSATVLRRLKPILSESQLFRPLVDRELARRESESHNQRQKRSRRNRQAANEVKLGHGGTLDPMATGVLIVGIGNGTKSLQRHLEGFKTYECVCLFGVSTDTYDVEGKIAKRAEVGHITKELVEEKLREFRGNITQRPPIYSALKFEGKKYYDYARAGKELPKEIKARPVRVEALEIEDWMEPGAHPYKWPKQDAAAVMRFMSEKILKLDPDGERKRKRSDDEADTKSKTPRTEKTEGRPSISDERQDLTAGDGYEDRLDTSTHAAAVRLRMTVGSGFYVRSLCHDLGVAVGSNAIMSELVRSQQGIFRLGENVLDLGIFEQEEQAWGPQVADSIDVCKAGANGKLEDAAESSDDNPPTRRQRGPKKSPQKAHQTSRRRNSSSVSP